VRGTDRDGLVTRAARCGRAIRFLTRALPGCIDAHLSQSRRRRIRRIRAASLTQRGRIEKPNRFHLRAYIFYDRLHGNIARCVMLTRQHRSLKDRESLPHRERAQGERTSVPSSGVDTNPHATAHRGGNCAVARRQRARTLPTAKPKKSLVT